MSSVTTANTTFGKMISEHACNFPDKTAIIAEYNDKVLSYAQFNERVNRLANGLMHLGFQKGDHIAIMSMNRAEYAEFFFALNKVGMVCTTVNFMYVADEVTYILEHSDARAFFFEAQNLEMVRTIRGRPEAKQVRLYVNLDATTDDFYVGYEDLLANSETADPDVAVTLDDDSLLIYTSGTTARPKGAIKKEGAVLWFTLQIAYNYSVARTKRWMCPTPQYHLGSEMITHMMLYVGGSLVIPRRFDPVTCLAFIDEYKVNGMFLTPAILNLVLNVPDKERYNVSSMEALLSSGGPLHQETKERANAFFRSAKLHNLYASTEFGGATLITQEEAVGKPIDTIGYPCLGSMVKIADSTGKALRRNEIGQIWVKNGAMNHEYHKSPEITRQRFVDGWISVGDVGFKDEVGYFHIVDRDKDLIISGGENIGSVEVEQVLIKHPKVAEVGVIGVPSERWGEEVKAVVVLQPGEEASEEEIRSYCKGKMAGFKVPKSVTFVAELPKTATGKVLKTELRKSYWRDRDRSIS